MSTELGDALIALAKRQMAEVKKKENKMGKYYIAYGTDTESLEDPDQLVLVGCPEDWQDLDSDDLIEQIQDHWGDKEVLEVQPLVGFQDIIESLKLIIPACNGLHPSTSKWVTEQIIDALTDAVDNNS